MLIATGFFDSLGNPCLKFHLAGMFKNKPGVEFEAVLDTGFSGFLSLPLIRAFPLGLPLVGTSSFTLADGSNSACLTASGVLTVGDKSETGLVVLETASKDALLGMDFLRTFKLALVVTREEVVLVDESVIDPIRTNVKQALKAIGPSNVKNLNAGKQSPSSPQNNKP